MAANVQDIPLRADETPTLNKALVAARKEIHNPHFDSTNPHFKSRFASLKAVIESVNTALLDHGITFIQDPRAGQGGINMHTTLAHEGGERQDFGPLFFPCAKDNVQGYASAVTYARRYHLMSIMGIVGDDDDDGNAASESAFSSRQAKSAARNKTAKAAHEGDIEAINDSWLSLDNDQKAELWTAFNKDEQRKIRELVDKSKESE